MFVNKAISHTVFHFLLYPQRRCLLSTLPALKSKPFFLRKSGRVLSFFERRNGPALFPQTHQLFCLLQLNPALQRPPPLTKLPYILPLANLDSPNFPPPTPNPLRPRTRTRRSWRPLLGISLPLNTNSVMKRLMYLTPPKLSFITTKNHAIPCFCFTPFHKLLFPLADPLSIKPLRGMIERFYTPLRPSFPFPMLIVFFHAAPLI